MMNPLHSPLIGAGETADKILGGRFKVLQKKRGYRFSLDALLLAHFVGLGPKGQILDVGTGSGIVALILSHLRPGSRIVGLEIQPELAEMAKRTLSLNGVTDGVTILEGDARRIDHYFPARSFDRVVFNPPYRRLSSGRINPDSQKAQARHEILGSLDDFLQAASFALKPGGRVDVVYPVRRMAELISRMREKCLEPKRCRIVHSSAGSRGEFILAEGVAGGREEMTMEPPLFIYEPDGRYTEAMSNLFNDLASSPSTAAARSPLS